MTTTIPSMTTLSLYGHPYLYDHPYPHSVYHYVQDQLSHQHLSHYSDPIIPMLRSTVVSVTTLPSLSVCTHRSPHLGLTSPVSVWAMTHLRFSVIPATILSSRLGDSITVILMQ
ncbi:hypothetical protein EB796_004490 [Bugula neritina]|uniref:Uncharacterized protein n=1 Tax=Bugula neritina TaxID=10212 RepID=A0A7J7KH46_BUGNE|nr:hypothetical protein EB796_004490 [Bugula neritina]